ncbi:MAG: hypothetical protein GX637_04820 [Clostridiales bacterium]|nr:hypothetical protein [Clostridiales bacterium]
MLSSEKNLNFFRPAARQNYPQQNLKHLHNSMQDLPRLIHGKSSETGGPGLHKQEKTVKMMRRRFQTIFPHYPQSYPQKKEKRTAFFLHLPENVWITWPAVGVIHRENPGFRPFFSTGFSPA